MALGEANAAPLKKMSEATDNNQTIHPFLKCCRESGVQGNLIVKDDTGTFELAVLNKPTDA